MASPQVDNGHTRISNEILEKLYSTNINGTQLRIVLFVIRKTYGWGKKRDKIALSQFVSAIGKDNSLICKNINTLVSMKIIIKIQDDNGSEYEFNKDYDEWELVSKMTHVKNDNDPVSKMTIDPVSKMTHTKENNTKETIQKKESKNKNFSPHYLSGKPSSEKEWRDLRRAELGKAATRTPRSEKQNEVFAALKWKDYFREQGHSQHGMQFFKVKNEKREKVVSKLVIAAAKEVEMKELIDWWFEGAGEWAEYEPEQCFSSKTLERFLNKDKAKKKNESEDIYTALKAIK